jgi:hypothetical protein
MVGDVGTLGPGLAREAIAPVLGIAQDQLGLGKVRGKALTEEKEALGGIDEGRESGSPGDGLELERIAGKAVKTLLELRAGLVGVEDAGSAGLAVLPDADQGSAVGRHGQRADRILPRELGEAVEEPLFHSGEVMGLQAVDLEGIEGP